MFKTLDAAYDEGIKHSCVLPMIALKRFAITFAPIRKISRLRVLSVYAICSQIRERSHRGRRYWSDKEFAPESGAWSAAVRSGVSLVGKDISGITRLLIDAEMHMFKGLRTPVISCKMSWSISCWAWG